MRKVACDICRQAMVNDQLSPGKYDQLKVLLHVKNNGDLIPPSDGVITACLRAQKHLKSSHHCTKLPKLQFSVKEEIGAYDISRKGGRNISKSYLIPKTMLIGCCGCCCDNKHL